MFQPRFPTLLRKACIALVLLLPAAVCQAADAVADKALEEQVLKIIRAHPKEIIDAVSGYQRAEAEKRERGVIDKLREKLEPMTTAELVGKSPSRGALEDTYVLIEFSDFQCPYCARAFETVQNFMAGHGGEVRLVYKHLPLVDLHREAMNAALAAWAAQQQGKFWEYHNALFKEQDKLGDQHYLAIAQRLGLDLPRFNRDRVSEAAQKAVADDMELAQKLGINSTPFFLLNKMPIGGAAPQGEFERLLGAAKGIVEQESAGKSSSSKP